MCCYKQLIQIGFAFQGKDNKLMVEVVVGENKKMYSSLSTWHLKALGYGQSHILLSIAKSEWLKHSR